MEEKTFKMVDEEGNELTCNVLFTFDSAETNKSYIAYTDNTQNEDGSLKAYAAIYHPEDFNKGFEPIETEKEWKVVETILSTIQEEIKSKLEKPEGESQDNTEGANNE